MLHCGMSAALEISLFPPRGRTFLPSRLMIYAGAPTTVQFAGTLFRGIMLIMQIRTFLCDCTAPPVQLLSGEQHWFGGDVPQESRWVAGHDGTGRHVAGDDAAGPDDGILPDDHVREDCRPGPDRRAFPHHSFLDLPVLLCLEFPRRSRRPWIGVVDEGDAVANEDVVLDCHAFTDEGVAGNLAPPAHLRILLDLDERPDLRFVADLAAVQVDELRELNVLPQLDVGRNVDRFVHRETTLDILHCPGPHQQAPFPEITAAGVIKRILISVQSERGLAYRRSRRTISSKVVRRLPATCQSPVIPGLASKTRRRCQGRDCSNSYGSGGRGPTSDISPRSTFHS